MGRVTALAVLGLLVACGPKDAPIDNPVDASSETGALTGPPPTATETLGAQALPVHERVNDAVHLLESGESSATERAIRIFEGVVSEEPDTPLAHFNLGVARQRQGRLAGARTAYQAALDLDPTLGDAWLYLGVIQRDSGRPDMALANFRTGVRRAPENMELRVALVSSLRTEGDLDQAVAEARSALGVNSNSLPIYNELGLAYLDKGDLQLAQFVYMKALGSVPGANESAYIHANLGWTFFQLGKTADAKVYLEKAVELDPELVPALVYLSKLYLDDRNYTDMVPLLETALTAQPDNYGVVLNLGIAYRGVGRHEDAAELYETALELDPSRPDPYYNLGILYGDHMKEYARAIEALETYISRGGVKRAQASEFIVDLEKEQERADRKREREAERRESEAERERRQKLLEESETDTGGQDTESPWGEAPQEAGRQP